MNFPEGQLMHLFGSKGLHCLQGDKQEVQVLLNGSGYWPVKCQQIIVIFMQCKCQEKVPKFFLTDTQETIKGALCVSTFA